MKNYPTQITKDNVVDIVTQIGRIRIEDITDRNNFPAVFVGGRSVGKIPSSSSDVDITDRIGDINITKDYIYTCVSDGVGGSLWRRIAQGAW